MSKRSTLSIVAAFCLTAIIADATLGGTAPMAASGTKRRVSAVVNTVTAVVTIPVVEKKIETTQVWVPEVTETVVTEISKVAEEPFRPYIPLATALMSLDCNANSIPDSTEISNGAQDSDSDGTLDSCEFAIGDLNLNGFIDSYDVSILLGWWGITNPLYGDLNGDHAVNAYDLGIILGRYGVVTF